MSSQDSNAYTGWPVLTNDWHSYDYLVVVPGLKSDFSKIEGLEAALSDASGPVSTIYKLDTVERTWDNIRNFKGGRAVSLRKHCTSDPCIITKALSPSSDLHAACRHHQMRWRPSKGETDTLYSSQ